QFVGPEFRFGLFRHRGPDDYRRRRRPGPCAQAGRDPSRRQAFQLAPVRRRSVSSPVKNAEMQRALEYLSGSLSEEAYLKAAGASRVDQTNVHFFVGLTRLAEGKRKAAHEHFRKAVQTGPFTSITMNCAGPCSAAWSGTGAGRRGFPSRSKASYC